MENLNASLNGFPVWLQYKPLALGIEKQVFQHIARHRLSGSKRIVQRLLRQHTRDERYLRNLFDDTARFNLDGTEAGVVTDADQIHAGMMIAAKHSGR